MTSANLLHAHDLSLDTPGGRPLFRDLTLIWNRGERVALVGRNGACKSSLLEVLAGVAAAKSGALSCYGRRVRAAAPRARAGCEPRRGAPLRASAGVRESR
jgi:ATP-binding cassette subfamily F protein uup